MPTETGYYFNIGPLITAEIARLRAKGCTKSDFNIRILAEKNIRRW